MNPCRCCDHPRWWHVEGGWRGCLECACQQYRPQKAEEKR